MKQLLKYAVLAPSPQNNQPWKFQIRENIIDIYLDTNQLLPSIDPLHQQSYIALGAVLENLVIAGKSHSYQPYIDILPLPTSENLVASVHFDKGYQPSDYDQNMFKAIELRQTNRFPYLKKEISESIWKSWQSICATEETKLRIVSDSQQKKELAKMISQGDRLAFESETIQKTMYQWMRFSKKDSLEKQDGLWIKTFGLNPLLQKMAPYLLRWESIQQLNRFNFSKMYASQTEKLVLNTPAIGLLTSTHCEHPYLTGGRVYQKLSLLAALEQIDFQPLSSILILNSSSHDNEQQEKQSQELYEQTTRFFKIKDSEQIILLFRLGYRQQTPPREPRRSCSDVMITTS